MHNRGVVLDRVELRDHRSRRPSWLKSRVRTLLNHVGAAGMTVITGGYARWVTPYQVEYTEHAMPLRGLPASFEGYRITQVSDLHTGYGTPLGFLRRVIDRVNEAPHDLTVVTGDLVTHKLKWVKAACEMVGRLRGPVVAIFGNHDYSQTSDAWASSEVAEALQEGLEERGVRVLRNSAMPIERGDGRLWVVGLEDLWSGMFSPEAAFSPVTNGDPVIALSHNPDTIHELEPFGPQWILAGHTHGGQIRVPVVGSMTLPIQDKRLDMGEFQLGRSRMYVTRGIGFRLPVRFRCRPEVPTFVLRRTAGG